MRVFAMNIMRGIEVGCKQRSGAVCTRHRAKFNASKKIAAWFNALRALAPRNHESGPTSQTVGSEATGFAGTQVWATLPTSILNPTKLKLEPDGSNLDGVLDGGRSPKFSEWLQLRTTRDLVRKTRGGFPALWSMRTRRRCVRLHKRKPIQIYRFSWPIAVKIFFAHNGSYLPRRREDLRRPGAVWERGCQIQRDNAPWQCTIQRRALAP
jgi:hypothetical protein